MRNSVVKFANSQVRAQTINSCCYFGFSMQKNHVCLCGSIVLQENSCISRLPQLLTVLTVLSIRILSSWRLVNLFLETWVYPILCRESLSLCREKAYFLAAICFTWIIYWLFCESSYLRLCLYYSVSSAKTNPEANEKE